MTLKIVEASIVHAGIISVLHGACFEEIWNEKSISEMLNMPGMIGFLIETEEKIPQGFIMMRVAADEAEIISIGVIPAARKKGLASILLLKSIKRAAISNVAKIFFEVAEDNKAAIAFYKTFGSQIIGKRLGYYKRSSKKIDAIIYSLNI
jgi:[ribosomal protein S18]-alanine N-acetyltransferase